MASSKLSAKAARLDFSSLPGAAVAPGAVSSGPASAAAVAPVAGTVANPLPLDALVRPKTAPGAMMAFAHDARSELVRENESLRQKAVEADQLRSQLDEALGDLQQWEGAKAARLIDPTLIQVSRFANRHDLNYSGPEFATLRAEVESAGGNVQPIKVRSLGREESGAPQRYELVFGHRRHRACLELGLPVLAVVDNLDDRALFVEMDRENRARKDLSAWEQGMMYRRALQQGLFASNRKLSEAIGVDLSALGKALALADLPEELIRAFASPLQLQFRWARPLADALASQRDAVLACAQRLAAGASDRAPKQVYEALVAAAAGQGVEPFHPPEAITLRRDGRAVGSLAMNGRGEVTMSLVPGELQAAQLGELAAAVEALLASRAQPAGRNRR